MSIRRFSLHWWLVATATIATLVLVGYFALRWADRYFFARITLRETTAIVKAKEYVRFDEANPFYINERGDRILVSQGDEQWRVYYQIDGFDNLDAAVRTRLLHAEEGRAAAGRLRFEFKSKEWHDKIEVGDKLKVLYQWHGGDKITVAYVENPKYPKLQ